MSEATIRINKVLKEFNIGMGTLIDFLKRKGVEVEPSPVAKITSEAYEMVAKEFGKELLIKEQSKKVAITVKEITEKEHHKDNADEVEPEEVLIKTNVLADKPVPPVRSETVAEKHSEMEKVSVEEIDKPKANPVVENTKTEEPVKTPEEEKILTEHKPDLKIVGKIDLSRPKKNEEERVQDEPKPVQTEEVLQKKDVENGQRAPEQQQSKHQQPVDVKHNSVQGQKPVDVKEPVQHIETKVEKLRGVKINGTIDLTPFEKKPSQNNNNVNSKKDKSKKRERIHNKGGARVDVPNSGANNNNNNNNNGKGKNKPQKRQVKFTRVEVDEDAIQKQIKETYARMTEGKGKTKGSKHRREKREIFEQKLQEEQAIEQKTSNILKVTEFLTVNELATLMDNTQVTKVIEACMNLGLMVSINQRLDAEAIVLVAEEFGYKIEFVTADNENNIELDVDKPEDLVPRPPIITVMGHVDHGKTSLLDYIRKANVIAGEAGGITQHIGAYNVLLSGGRHITFLDTPGHEAFTAMRARGAKITDIAIIIIAADDAVMPQTTEAIHHAQAAGVPMVFAINKIDKPGANSERIKEQLANMNLLVEDWGGKYQCQEISAKKGINVDKLLEKVLLEADLLDLKANPNKNAVGSVIESSLDKGRGYLATILVESGTLHNGDIMLSGCYTGRVKAMFNERGQKIESAGPSEPVSVLGLNGAPTPGDTFNVLNDEKEARDIANKREQLIRIQGIKTQRHITLEEIGRRIAIGNFQELNIIVKADVDGSIEALSDSLIKLSTDEIHVNVIHKAVGGISESDVLLAAASNAIIIGFQVRPSVAARKLAENEEIDIRLYSVIYDAINEVKSGIEGMLAPEEKEEITATAEVREIFKISKVGTIAGCMVKEGKLTRTSKIRVVRDGIVIHTGTLGSLKRFKDDVKEVASGYDCGLNIDGFNDIKTGDIIEAYNIVEVKRKLS